jgi:hypothetical protein
MAGMSLGSNVTLSSTKSPPASIDSRSAYIPSNETRRRNL